MTEVALIHVAVTCAMTGLIWFVQVVHYPLFRLVGPDGARTYQKNHEKRTGWVVAPLMLAETAAAILLALRVPSGVPPILTVGSLILVAVIWWSTFFLQVPQHRVLEGGADAGAYAQLVRTNWVRTVAWTIRSVIAVLIVSSMI
jgi:hypothetical protein